MKTTKLQKQYESVCTEYVNEFCNKQGLLIDWKSNMYWVGGEVGGILSVGDYFFNFTDIVWDINSKQPPKLIFKWYDSCLEDFEDMTATYYSYTKNTQK